MNKKKLFYISAFLFFTAILGLFFTAEFNTNFKVDSEYFLNSVENKEKQLEYYFFKQELAQKLLKDALLMEKEVKNYLASRENSHIDNYDLYWTSFTKEMGLLYSSFTQNSLEKEKQLLDDVMDSYTKYTISYTNLRSITNTEKSGVASLSRLSSDLDQINKKIVLNLDSLNLLYAKKIQKTFREHKQISYFTLQAVNENLISKTHKIKQGLYFAIFLIFGGFLIYMALFLLNPENFQKEKKQEKDDILNLNKNQNSWKKIPEENTEIKLDQLKKETRSPYLKEVFYGKP
ncbi:hypothetical protein HOC37_05600 [bacterium]|nr:hypothetical protein [bacterium]MBT3580870.1 hypothetical protein [bacterium]MBT4552436.1 hypothetical protein [bacterium]MBT7087780.1 hypothetical protein [bacterium]